MAQRNSFGLERAEPTWPNFKVSGAGRGFGDFVRVILSLEDWRHCAGVSTAIDARSRMHGRML